MLKLAKIKISLIFTMLNMITVHVCFDFVQEEKEEQMLMENKH